MCSPDPIDVNPVELLINVYTHGILDLGIIQYPYATDLYSTLGNYESITGYKLVISNNVGIEIFNSKEFSSI